MRYLNPEGESDSVIESSYESDFLRVSQALQKANELKPTSSNSLYKPLSSRGLDPDFKEVWVYLISPASKKVKIELLSKESFEMHSIPETSLFFISIRVPSQMKLLCYRFLKDGHASTLIKLQNSEDLLNAFHTEEDLGKRRNLEVRKQ